MWRWLVCLCLLLPGCQSQHHYAPVTDIHTESIPRTGYHHVKPGETLYEIAWRYGLDYRAVAKRNQMTSPYVLYTGQSIYLRGKPPQSTKRVISVATKSTVSFPVKPTPEPHFSTSSWVWPAKGKVITSFSSANQGIDIAGVAGEPIYAAGAGKVVYCGNGLRAYGNLIILKHNSVYLSAYAHNQNILVKEGEWVKPGQKIAEMGNTGTDKTMLHFEIRRAGKPVNPLSLYRRAKL